MFIKWILDKICYCPTLTYMMCVYNQLIYHHVFKPEHFFNLSYIAVFFPPWRIMWLAWPFLPALVLLSELSVVRVQTAPCQTCRKLTESFIKVQQLSYWTIVLFISSQVFRYSWVLRFFLFLGLGDYSQQELWGRQHCLGRGEAGKVRTQVRKF